MTYNAVLGREKQEKSGFWRINMETIKKGIVKIVIKL